MAGKRKECVHFGAAVRRFREKQGHSQESFADKVRVHRTYLGGIERGERNPTLTTIHRVADALGVSVWQLFRDAEESK